MALKQLDWERAMGDVAVGNFGAMWRPFADAGLHKDAVKLELLKYSQAAYNQRR